MTCYAMQHQGCNVIAPVQALNWFANVNSDTYVSIIHIGL